MPPAPASNEIVRAPTAELDDGDPLSPKEEKSMSARSTPPGDDEWAVQPSVAKEDQDIVPRQERYDQPAVARPVVVPAIVSAVPRPVALTTFPRRCIVAIEVLKIIDFLFDLLKVVFNEPGGRQYWGWVSFSFAMALFVLVQKVVDQSVLLMLSARWPSGKMWFVGCLFFPLTMICGPFTYFNFGLYNMSKPDSNEVEIFVQRPLSSVLLGLPGYSIISSFVADVAIVNHPLNAHLRAVQGVYQTMLQDLPDICIDVAVIVNRPVGADVSLFWLSLILSIITMFTVNVFSVYEADNALRSRCLRERSTLTATTATETVKSSS